MRRPRLSRNDSPAAEQPPAASARSLVEYRFTVVHQHGARAYRVGDIIECDEATASRIRRYAGAGALVPVHGRAS
ncbi:MAG: hypothetical protein ACTHK2_04995 [Dokdonella sp.]|uniref:hypothetical protein n=1 Tax=Dokdonella sp. TaxID=2291710 RepID=UPI003F7E3E0D